MTRIKLEIEAEPEKIRALHIYLSGKNTSLESEIEHHIESLYKKNVPNVVRDYISACTQNKKNGKEVEGNYDT